MSWRRWRRGRWRRRVRGPWGRGRRTYVAFVDVEAQPVTLSCRPFPQRWSPAWCTRQEMTRLAVRLVVYRETRSHSLPSSCWTPSFWPTANRSQVPVTFYYARLWWVLPRHLLPMPFGRRFSGEAIFAIRDVWVSGRRWRQSHACVRPCGRPQREHSRRPGCW